MIPLFPFLIATFVVAGYWTALWIRDCSDHPPVNGLAGSWVSILAMSALWQAESVPWLLMFIKGILIIWIGAIIYLFSAAIAIRRLRKPGWKVFFCCAVLSLLFNVAGLLQFLWTATVSAGGV